jgi:hypothetical protein
MGVGNEGLAPLALCAKVLGEMKLSPSAWLRSKPKVLSFERRKRGGFISFRYVFVCNEV